MSIEFLVTTLFAPTSRGHDMARPAIMTWMGRSFAAVFVALGAKLPLIAK